MRLINSDRPYNPSSARPSGNIANTGQRIKPPALDDISLVTKAFVTRGIARKMMAMTKGTRHQHRPTMSIQICVRLEKRPETTSIFTCSWRISV